MWLLLLALSGVEGLALQISLADERATPNPVPSPTIFTLSPDGAWLAVGEPAAVHVYDARTLSRVAVLEVEARSAAFDEDGRVLTLAGSDWIRVETGTWRGLSRAPLPDLAPERPPAEADDRRMRFSLDPPPARRLTPVVLARPGGEVYYLTTSRTIRRAVGDEDLGGKQTDMVPQRITGLLGFAGGIPIVELESLTGIVLRQKCYTLSASWRPLDGAELGGLLVLLTETSEGVYDTRTWKSLRQRTIRGGASLAVAPKRAWAFTADADGIHAWRPDVPQQRVAVGPPVRRLAVDAAGTALFAADRERLLRWRIEAP